MNRIFRFLLVAFSVVIITSCGEYQKVLKSTDYEYKYKKAKEYYEKKQYAKSVTLFEEVAPIFSGTSKAAEAYYYYAKSYLGQKDYYSAAMYFRSILEKYPRSEYAEECQYLVGYCFYQLSPYVRLDQSDTDMAISALTRYTMLYPDTEKAKEADHMIKKLNDKLTYKAYLNATLYYDLEDFKAAVVSLKECLREYPNSKYTEDLMYKLFRAKYLLGRNSVDEKKRKRLNSAMDEYYRYVDAFPESKHRKDVDRSFAHIKKMLNLKEEDLNIK
ncbi:outer membrane protein assembly factor BamD [Halosquirtibacter xylanolyticus]|uniref:outer membrane protein assembly factor BamD n=1 Tax=Halosquirtibacter xylanolyticus TaxID=3374599 RepID=UPI003749B466|nr:outer membrane protein assembly factor BamD [Prolixibacteraceae bacterium]